ncbi:MAG TPA: DUF1189 family protein [Dissulfurispiraceae bacterium]|nr:DUF1189 family protein [Dissulfurispiraceae bacterium]
MKKYTIIHPLYMSFYSKSLYREVAAEWSARLCFLYLLSLVALCWIPGTIRISSEITDYVNDEAPKYIRQFPEIEISKGQASVSAAQPYIIKNPDNGDPIAIIDTTGQTASMDNPRTLILLTKTGLITRDYGSKEMHTVNLSDVGDITINKDLIYDWIEAFTEWFPFAFYPAAVAAAFVYRSIQVLLYALGGSVFLRGLMGVFNYRLLIRLSTVSLTPVIILNAIVLFFGIEIPASWLVNALVSAGYLIFAIRSAVGPAKE